MVVVAIIGVLAAVAIPAYNGYRNTAAENAAKSEASEIMKALQACSTIDTASACYDPTAMGTLSKSCNQGVGATAPNMASCVLDLKGTHGCASAHVQGVGGIKSYCVLVEIGTGQVNAIVSGPNKHCNNAGTNATCT